MQEKVTTLEEAIGLINDGDVVALQNMATQAAPMALVRELIRQEKRDLGLVVLVGGMAVDWLATAGVINRLIGAAVTMEQFGLCQQYRQSCRSRVESGLRNYPSRYSTRALAPAQEIYRSCRHVEQSVPI